MGVTRSPWGASLAFALMAAGSFALTGLVAKPAVGAETVQRMIVVRVTFDKAGNPLGFELREAEGLSQEETDALYVFAKRAILEARADGSLSLPAEDYETWKVLDLVFAANGMRTR